MSRFAPRTVSSATSVRKRHRPVLCSAFTRSCNFPPTAPLRYIFGVDLGWRAATSCNLRPADHPIILNEQERKNIMTKTHLPLLLALLGVVGNNQFAWASDPAHADQLIVPPAEAISWLKEGNERYTRGKPQHPHESSEERTQLATNSYE